MHHFYSDYVGLDTRQISKNWESALLSMNAKHSQVANPYAHMRPSQDVKCSNIVNQGIRMHNTLLPDF